MKWKPLSVSALALVFLAASGLCAQASVQFTDASIQGSFGFAFNGTFVDGSATAAVGSLQADGRGHAAGDRTLVVGPGAFSRLCGGSATTACHLAQTFECTYAVNSDGTGTARCNVSSPFGTTQETLAFVNDRLGQEFQLIGTDPQAVVRGVAVKHALPRYGRSLAHGCPGRGSPPGVTEVGAGAGA